MGEAELHADADELIIHSIICIYGDAATNELAKEISDAIAMHWNEPEAVVALRRKDYRVRFRIEGMAQRDLDPAKVWYNDDPKWNFFRVEDYAVGNISFVDGIGCNTGYFKLDNLKQTTTTAAHEYGHTLGLVHPQVLDIRGGLQPSIMYPRGTLCDAALQYDPTAKAGEHGGFLDPKYRRVTIDDILNLRLHKLDFNDRGFSRVGDFSSFFHEKHGREM